MSALVLMAFATRATAAGTDCAPNAHACGDSARLAISELPWADSSDWIHNPPSWLRDIVDSRRRRAPVPVVHLWRSQQTQTLLSLGVNRRGLPGLYISRLLPY
jgi:hypothetical protein